MNWTKTKYLLFLLALTACKSEQLVQEIALPERKLIEVEQLTDLLEMGQVQLVDFRKKDAFLSGHIPGAVNLWRSDIENTEHQTAGLMATAAQLEARLSKLGIDNEKFLVVYDNNGNCDASRFWWVMKQYGYNKVYLLNGGLKSWQAGLSNTAVKLQESRFKLPYKSPKPERYLDHNTLFELLEQEVVVIDARSADEFSGKRLKNGAARAGRIPKSINMDWVITVNLDGDHKFKSLEELQTLFQQIDTNKDSPIVVYCHSGVRSAHMTFVLTELMGYTNVKNFDGSWIDWSAAAHLPITQDSLITLQN